MSPDAKALVLLASIVLATTCPFIHRAYFVDDYYFVTMAKGILQNPARPYDFKSNDAGKDNVGWERGQRPRMVNPPLFHYYLAGVMKIFGDSEAVLRSSMIPWSFLTLVAMFFLGKRFSTKPLYSAVLLAVTPMYWLTSYSLLIDAMLLALILTGLWAFVAAHEKKRVSLAVLAGLFLGLGMLVKYFGVIGIVLAAVWQIMDPKRRVWRGGLLVFVVFFALQGLWAAWNIRTYGQSHLWATLPRGMSSVSHFLVDKLLVTASFFGGGSIWALAGYGFLWKRSKGSLGLLLLLMLAATLIFLSPVGGFTRSQSFQLVVWIGAGAAFVLSVLFRWKDPEAPQQRFLIVWVVLGIMELLIVMPWTAARYFLCLLPPACWLLTHMISDKRWRLGILFLTGAAGLSLASADYLQADTIRHLAQALPQDMAVKVPKFYLGDTFSGFGPYLEPLGWVAAFPDQVFKKGDLLLVARYRQSSWWRLPASLRLKPVEVYEFQNILPVRVMDIPGSAGWYASVWGSLPWVITNDPFERYEVYSVL